MNETNKLKRIQRKIGYEFTNQELIRQALTTPQYGHEHDRKDYEILETLGDSVIKLIFILNKYKEGIETPGEITQLKQQLENDRTLKKIAQEYFELQKYIFKSESQDIEGTKILADILEAICGALFLDANQDLQKVENIIIRKFYDDWDEIIKNSSILNKNKLLELLQDKLRFNPVIKTDFRAFGPDNKPIWIANNPRIYNQQNELMKDMTSLINNLESNESRSKKQAEQNLYYKMFKKLKTKI